MSKDKGCYNCGREIDGYNGKLLFFGNNEGWQNICKYCERSMRNQAIDEIKACTEQIMKLSSGKPVNEIDSQTINLNASRIRDKVYFLSSK